MKPITLFAVTLLLAALTAPCFAEWESIGPDGAYFYAMGVAPSDPDIIYAQIYDYPENYSRCVRTTDGGASWAVVGRLPYYYPWALKVDPWDSDIVYVVCRSQTFYRSTDGGATWLSSTLPAYGYGMEVDPFVPGRVYAAGYISDGTAKMALYISTDHGASWSYSIADPVGSSYAYACGASRADSGTVYVGGGTGKIYRTTDAGATWQSVQGNLPSLSIYAIAPNPGDPDIVAIGSTGSGVYRTEDGGATWTRTGAMTQAYYVEFSPASPNRGYAAYDQMYATTDYGASWFIPVPGIRYNYVKAIAPHPTDGDKAYVAGSCGLYKTEDGGTNWSEAHNGIRLSKVSCISVNPQNPDRVYLEIYQQAVFNSQDGGETWSKCGAFLSCGNVCGIGVAPGADADILYALEGAG